LIGLACSDAEQVILTDRRIVTLTGGHARVTNLTTRLPAARAVVRVVAATPDNLFVGTDAGEWGGGMQRIDRRSRAITAVERNASGELCDGPLNSSCDPVNAIVPIPGRPGCVAAAVGLIHMLASGRVVSVCGDRVEALFTGHDPDSPELRSGLAGRPGADRYQSVAFFGLAAQGNALLAVGHTGLYRIAADGTGRAQPWPRFRRIDGVLVSFALPDVVLATTDVTRSMSMSGITPLLIPR